MSRDKSDSQNYRNSERDILRNRFWWKLFGSPESSHVFDGTTGQKPSRKELPGNADLEIVLDGNLKDISSADLAILVDRLRKLSGDSSIQLFDIEEGSIIVRLNGTEEGFRIIKELWETGKLKTLIGLDIESVEFKVISSSVANEEEAELNGHFIRLGDRSVERVGLQHLSKSEDGLVARVESHLRGDQRYERTGQAPTSVSSQVVGDKPKKIRWIWRVISSLFKSPARENRAPALLTVLHFYERCTVQQRAILENQVMSGDRQIDTGGGNYIESNTGTYIQGDYIQGDYIHMEHDLSRAAVQIQSLIEQLQKSGMTVDIAQEQVAKDLATQAQTNATVKDKLLKWGQSLGDATVSDVIKGTVKLAIRSAGIPLP